MSRTYFLIINTIARNMDFYKQATQVLAVKPSFAMAELMKNLMQGE